jgi:hypothetical protein
MVQLTAKPTVYFYLDELFGTEVDETTLTREQLIEAIQNYDRVVVRQPDGRYNMLDYSCHDYEFAPAWFLRANA